MIAPHQGLLLVTQVRLENIFVTPATPISWWPFHSSFGLMPCDIFHSLFSSVTKSGFLCHSCMGLLLLSTLSFSSFLYQSYLMWCLLWCWHINYIVDSSWFLALWIELKLLQVCDLALREDPDSLSFLESVTVLSCVNSSYKTHNISVFSKSMNYCINTLYWYFFVTSINILPKELAPGYFPFTAIFFPFLLFPLCLSVIASGTAYLHFVLLGKLLCLFQNIAEMKNAILKTISKMYICMILDMSHT